MLHKKDGVKWDNMISAEQIKENGIVGAGGAGFPTYVKLSSQAEIFIVNAAECEPLLHKDKEILLKKTKTFLTGLKICMELVGSRKCIIAIKAKHIRLIEHLKSMIEAPMEIFPMGDFYPAGDEITLIYETTGRIVEGGQLPITQNVIVNNVETIFNVGKQTPVTTKFLTVGGDVRTPYTVEAPIGIAFSDLIEAARPVPARYCVIVGGPMMGVLTEDFDQPVTKTTGGLLVFSSDHPLARRLKIAHTDTWVNYIGKSACDQCAMCSELCPRNLLGHSIQPHKAMRSLIFTDGMEDSRIDKSLAHTLYCCECNLCSLVSCPEGLYPAQVSIKSKKALMRKKAKFTVASLGYAHPLISYRRTPVSKIMAKLDLLKFQNTGELIAPPPSSRKLTIALQQHIGAPATALVQPGDRVDAQSKIASVGNNLGAEIHTPVDGTVTRVTATHITIERS